MESQYAQQPFVFHGQQQQFAPVPLYSQQQLQQQQQKMYDNAQFIQTAIDAPADFHFVPSTPPLSISGSTVNSPPTHSVLPTPVSAGGFEFSLDASVKPELHLAHLNAASWASFQSPPLTPVYTGSVPPYQFFNHNNIAISTAVAPAPQHISPAELSVCPSLSPSPSPLSRSVVSSDDFIQADFCDPRQLVAATVIAPASPVAHSHGPTLCSGDNDEHKLLLSSSTTGALTVSVPAVATSPEISSAFSFSPDLSLFSELDVDVEEDLYSSFNGTSNSIYLGTKRQRVEEDITAEDLELFTEYDSLANPTVLTPAAVEAPQPPMKKARKSGGSRKSKKSSSEESSDDSLGASNGTGAATTASAPASAEQQTASDGAAPASEQSSDGSETGSEGSSESGGANAPVVRRGRKQSLTEDPSKTFVCDLCHRRFRRQEHLKRHYRSLHTHDKPFSCGECGKKFSRSDNLAQHSRTHGAGTVVMGVLEDGDIPPGETGHKMSEVEQLGVQLFDAAQAVANSSTSSSAGSSPPASASDKNRKRKREE